MCLFRMFERYIFLIHFLFLSCYRWFARDVITAMLVSENKRSLISSNLFVHH